MFLPLCLCFRAGEAVAKRSCEEDLTVLSQSHLLQQIPMCNLHIRRARMQDTHRQRRLRTVLDNEAGVLPTQLLSTSVVSGQRS